jgi:hypothetical protein
MGMAVERHRRPVRFRVGLFLFVALMLSACSPASPAASGPATWIDAPLDGSQFPLGQIGIVLHAASQSGIRSVELTVDGRPLATLTPDDSQSRIVHLQTEWSPASPGEYRLAARAFGDDGSAGQPAMARVVVMAAKPTSTPASPAVTVTPTAAATDVPTPTVTVAATGIGQISLSGHQVYWGSGSCQPTSVTTAIQAADPTQVASAIFFFRLESAGTHEMSEWSQGRAMNPQEHGHFDLRVTGDQLAKAAEYTQAIVHYQIALQLQDGSIVRSSVHRDLAMSQCGAGAGATPTGEFIVPPMVTIEPTAPTIH